MGLFRKRKQNKLLTSRQEALAGKVAAVIVYHQARIANYLNRKTAYWNKRAKITALLLFCLAFGGISLYLLIKAIY